MGERDEMMQWEYQITLHQLPDVSPSESEQVIKCDQTGQCFIHDTFRVGIEWLENIFSERGKEGWELVQSGYHHRELLCIWKRKQDPKKSG